MELIKVVLLGIVISLLAVFLRTIRSEYSILCIVIGSLILIYYIVNSLVDIFAFFNNVMEKTGIDQDLFVILLKIIGVGYLVEFSAGICSDSGNTSIANKVVLAGKILIFLLSMPIIKNLFEMVMDLL
ncbi:MAG: hypothetical protein E7354_01365 [Clostridiales bacterium]|nr:hypothetical protein [Clostridiales bacterium]